MVVNKEKLKQLLIDNDYEKLQDCVRRGFYNHYDIQQLGYCGMCFEKLNNNNCPNWCNQD